MEILYSKAAVKALKQMEKDVRNRLLSGIEGLTQTPPQEDIKAMQGKEGIYRLRVGKYRVLYHYENDALKIDDIGSRGDIYK